VPTVIALNKPYGLVSQFTPKGGHPGLAGLGLPPRVYAVGRLDRDSEGLLLLTDAGWLQHRLSHPRFAHPRTYLAQVEHIPEPAALERLAAGLTLKDGPTLPCSARLLEDPPTLPPRDPPVRARKTIPTAWLELILREGRNRQVRRMTAAIGHPTLRLVRVAVAGIRLDDLAPGAWRALHQAEVDTLGAGGGPPQGRGRGAGRGGRSRGGA